MVRNNIFRVVFIWGLLIALVALVGKFAVASENSRATADFLNIGTGARPAGFAGAYTSLAEGAEAVYWNPGGVSLAESPQITASHYSWYQDINYEFIAASYPVSERFSIGVGASYLSYGKISGFDEFNSSTGDIGSTYDLAGGLTIGMVLSENISVGITGKYIMLSLAGQTAGAMAADLGVTARFNRFTAGAALSNIGGKIKFSDTGENLPTSLRAGLSAELPELSLVSTLEFENQFYGDFAIRSGLEYSFLNQYFLRGGYRHYSGNDLSNESTGLTFGAGAILGPARFDYAIAPSDKISSEMLHRISVTINLGQ